MKNNTLLVLAAVGIGGFLLYKYYNQGEKTAIGNFAIIPQAPNPQEAPPAPTNNTNNTKKPRNYDKNSGTLTYNGLGYSVAPEKAAALQSQLALLNQGFSSGTSGVSSYLSERGKQLVANPYANLR